ncbi:biosynthetic arginine decarboxylase [Aporhodopirellula aestuarii]|uniref:Biosynthetic arginine decarboxylase n=1 Tax=Aporhodopirellula aestuarii TaxID=2950107 RepID=A0ABT0U1J2_9BACT|nr:biosynthetic arginine decarboxylase [Aporhodopirellula aestuarii]MCM2370511.1 biosynthetic arginine decarboxylase [Aporhodopirellula aestuarii]
MEKNWTLDDAASQYGIERWGDGYFSISPDGTVLVTPQPDLPHSVDLKLLVDRLIDRGLELPILLRFNGILRDRLRRIDKCFRTAISDHNYENRYRCVFPIKVNQQREVVQQIVSEGSELGFGIEAGSKPELVAAVAMGNNGLPIICNGFKDEEFIRLALHAQRLGRTVLPVVEKVSELDLILRVAKEVGVRPTFGIRVKLATRGSGRWQASGGYRSKFGLTVAEVLAQLDRLIEIDMGDCFQLLHFHVGSQIGNIRQLKSAILEAARIYADLKKRGAAMGYLDVGGGLGVDYDGSQSDNESSMNYTMQEYANDVVYHVQTVCDEAEVPHPQLISESGRAVTAQHSVLVMETLGVTSQGESILPDWARVPAEEDLASAPDDDGDFGDDNDLGAGRLSEEVRSRQLRNEAPAGPPDDFEQPVHDLWEQYKLMSPANMLETFHDAQVALDLCMNLFSGGYLPLEQRVAAETLYFAICHRARDFAMALEEIPEDLAGLDCMLSDIYFANFSLFQSMPDSWAIDQLFPIMPIHRLEERPTRHAVLGDITCDSDGKIDSFVGDGQRTETLMLHPLRAGEPYQLGVFMVGAYQEILGDLHNLFGDTHAVHIEVDGDATKIRSIVKGDTVSEVLGYVQYEDRELVEAIQDAVEHAVGSGMINHQQAGNTVAAYERALAGYTYLTSRRTLSADEVETSPAQSSSQDSPEPAKPSTTNHA